VSESAEKSSAEVLSAAACAQAAAWIARLHADDRTLQVEAGFNRWLAASPEHRAAFEMANDLWTSIEELPKPKTPAFVRLSVQLRQRSRFICGFIWESSGPSFGTVE